MKFKVIYFVKGEQREKIIKSTWEKCEKDALKASKRWEDIIVVDKKNAIKINY